MGFIISFIVGIIIFGIGAMLSDKIKDGYYKYTIGYLAGIIALFIEVAILRFIK